MGNNYSYSSYVFDHQVLIFLHIVTLLLLCTNNSNVFIIYHIDGLPYFSQSIEVSYLFPTYGKL